MKMNLKYLIRLLNNNHKKIVCNFIRNLIIKIKGNLKTVIKIKVIINFKIQTLLVIINTIFNKIWALPIIIWVLVYIIKMQIIVLMMILNF